MNWKYLKWAPWLDARAAFVASLPRGGRLLDLGSSDGETLGHFAELRPDLRLSAVDLEGAPERYPAGCEYQQANLESDRLRWSDGSFDGVTCMHLVEHLQDLGHLFREIARLLKPGGGLYVETPHPKTVIYSSAPGVDAGTFTCNFFDDLTHVRVITCGALAVRARQVGLVVERTGISRNWIFAASWPLLAVVGRGRSRHTAWGHFLGWSACMTARR